MGRSSFQTEVLGRLGDHGPVWGSGEPWTLQGRGGDSPLAEGWPGDGRVLGGVE